MAISKAMHAALHTLSYAANIDVGKTYKVERVLRGLRTPLSPLYRVWDHQIERDGRGITVRIYTPKKQTDNRLLLFFHGGGWVLESVDTYNRVCARMSQSTGHIVVSVEYRLAPEYRFPTALMDCYAAAKALYTNKLILNTDPRKITIMGDSAGGNLAAAVALMARDKGDFQVFRQILIYPALYNTYTTASPYASVQKNGTDYLLTAVKMQDYLNLYESCPEDRVNPYFAPLLARDFSNMPETLILTAEFDPLRDEGEDYGKKLAEAGNYVEVHRIKDALHGFFALGIRFFHVQESFSYMNEFLKREV